MHVIRGPHKLLQSVIYGLEFKVGCLGESCMRQFKALSLPAKSALVAAVQFLQTTAAGGLNNLH
jgi:hypothetical protein